MAHVKVHQHFQGSYFNWKIPLGRPHDYHSQIGRPQSSSPPMNVGDFCSNWTGDSQVHPLDPRDQGIVRSIFPGLMFYTKEGLH